MIKNKTIDTALDSLDNNISGLYKLANKILFSLDLNLSSEEEEDIIQESIYILLKNIDQWDSNRNLSSWASVVLRNAMLRHEKSLKKDKDLISLDSNLPELGHTDSLFSRAEDKDYLLTIWSKFSTKEKKVVKKKINNESLSRQEYNILKKLRERFIFYG